MKFRLNNKYLYWGITAFLVVAASLLFYYILFHMNNIKSAFDSVIRIGMPIIDGLVLAYLLAPLVNWLERSLFFPLCDKLKLEKNRKCKKTIRLITTLITVIFLLTVLYFFCMLIVPQVIESIQNIIGQFPTYINNLLKWIENLLKDNPKLSTLVNDLIVQYSSQIEGYANTKLLPQLNELVQSVSTTLFSSVINVFRIAWNFIIGIVISIYLLLSKEVFIGQCKKIIYAILSIDNANATIKNIRFVHTTFSGFINGKLIDSLIIGLLCFIGMTLLNMPYPLLISLIIGVTNIIPFFGPYIGAIPSIILILMVDPIQALYFGIFILILQQFDGNILGPKILGDKTGLSSFWVIFSITLFGGYWGVLGMAIGVPVFAVIYAFGKAFVRRSLKKKGLSTSTTNYLDLDRIDCIEEYNYIKLTKSTCSNSSISNSDEENNETQSIIDSKSDSSKPKNEKVKQKKDKK